MLLYIQWIKFCLRLWFQVDKMFIFLTILSWIKIVVIQIKLWLSFSQLRLTKYVIFLRLLSSCSKRTKQEEVSVKVQSIARRARLRFEREIYGCKNSFIIVGFCLIITLNHTLISIMVMIFSLCKCLCVVFLFLRIYYHMKPNGREEKLFSWN